MGNILTKDCETVLKAILGEIEEGSKCQKAINHLRREFYHTDQFEKEQFDRIIDELIRLKYLAKEKTQPLRNPFTKKMEAQPPIIKLTLQGQKYFSLLQKNEYEEAKKMFIKLDGERRNFLLELVKNKDSLGSYVESLYKQTNEEDKLNGLFGYLKDRGFVNVMWADDIAYNVTLTYSGENYLDLEQEFIQNSKTTQTINIHGNAQVITENHGTVIQNNGVDSEKLTDLLNQLLEKARNELVPEDLETVTDCVSEISQQVTTGKVKKGVMNALLNALSAIKGTAEFTAAVIAITQFVQNLL